MGGGRAGVRAGAGRRGEVGEAVINWREGPGRKGGGKKEPGRTK